MNYTNWKVDVKANFIKENLQDIIDKLIQRPLVLILPEKGKKDITITEEIIKKALKYKKELA